MLLVPRLLSVLLPSALLLSVLLLSVLLVPLVHVPYVLPWYYYPCRLTSYYRLLLCTAIRAATIRAVTTYALAAIWQHQG